MSKTQLWVGGVFVIYFVAFFVAPIVPFRVSVSIPGAYRSGYTVCFPGGYLPPGVQPTEEEQSCLASYALPDAAVDGYATPAYRAFGLGQPPFQRVEVVSRGNHSALLYFDGSSLQAAEEINSPSVQFNPPSVVEFYIAPVYSSDFGFINITIQVRNVGVNSIMNPTVYLSMAGFSSNTTAGALTWIEPRLVGGCPAVWAPAAYCAVTQVVRNQLPANASFNYYAEIRGYDQTGYFVYRQGFGEAYPEGGVGPIWVDRFIGLVDRARAQAQLNESSTLDAFAALRFRDAAPNFQISDYGFQGDVASFFGGNKSTIAVEELLLYPGRLSPTAFAAFLSTYAPTHWSALTDPTFTKFGYFVGHSTYYEILLPCSVYEIPGPGINITQYFQSQGCRTIVQPAVTWLVLILSS
ncbi:MAG: hypothetical protein JRN06_01715 [Nitrososphaerota archaeon]|nr:hypothetical protein [Nitrososphaerota archaeon]MDG7023428.1 hypothetical protein [Nitrososphaerota archaeon]